MLKTESKRALSGTLAGGGLFALGLTGYWQWRLAVTVAVLGSLWIFGYFYNRWVQAIGDDQDGFTWLLVVIGVGATLVGIGLLDLVLDWNAALISLMAFAASGCEMARGDVLRYIALRRRLRTL